MSLAQARKIVAGITFDAAAFPGYTPEHLEYIAVGFNRALDMAHRLICEAQDVASERVTVYAPNGYAMRVRLPEPHWTGSHEIGTGFYLLALYRGPKSGRMFALVDSRWETRNGSGEPRGERYEEIDLDRYLHLCAEVGTEPVDFHAEHEEV